MRLFLLGDEHLGTFKTPNVDGCCPSPLFLCFDSAMQNTAQSESTSRTQRRVSSWRRRGPGSISAANSLDKRLSLQISFHETETKSEPSLNVVSYFWVFIQQSRQTEISSTTNTGRVIAASKLGCTNPKTRSLVVEYSINTVCTVLDFLGSYIPAPRAPSCEIKHKR